MQAYIHIFCISFFIQYFFHLNYVCSLLVLWRDEWAALETNKRIRRKFPQSPTLLLNNTSVSYIRTISFANYINYNKRIKYNKYIQKLNQDLLFVYRTILYCIDKILITFFNNYFSYNWCTLFISFHTLRKTDYRS